MKQEDGPADRDYVIPSDTTLEIAIQARVSKEPWMTSAQNGSDHPRKPLTP